MTSSAARPDARTTGVDVGLAVLTAAGIALAIAVFREPDARPPDVWAYTLGALVAVPLLWRRRAPRVVLLANYALLAVYYASGYPAVGLVLPLVVALATTATAGHLAFASGLLAVGILVSGSYRLGSEAEAVLPVLDDTLRDAALGTAAILLGAAVRARRALVDETRARLDLLAAEREREADARVERERVRLARELHDELAHSVTVMGLHADVATEAIDAASRDATSDLAPVRDAVTAIRGVARDTMTDLRRTLGALRSVPAEGERGPAPGAAALPRLLEHAAAAGLTTDLEVRLGGTTLSATLDRTVHRLVQEAVTNTLRHATAHRVEVEIAVEGGDLAVRVSDDGRTSSLESSSPETSTDGHGLAGMRERVRLLDGAFEAGPDPDGGWCVRARLPLDGARQPSASTTSTVDEPRR